MRGGFVPGDVAIVTVPTRTAPNGDLNDKSKSDVWVVKSQAGWVALCNLDYYWHDDYSFFDGQPRRLVVIDPEDREQVERLAAACRIAFGWTSGPSENDTTATQAALRSLIADPKPEEPLGLGAVVEDADDVLWVRRAKDWTTRPWVRATATGFYEWYEIAAVKVLSGGVTE